MCGASRRHRVAGYLRSLGHALERGSLLQQILQLEQLLLDPAVRRSPEKLQTMLADEFVEFASTGAAYRKGEVIEALQHESPHRRTLSQFKVVPLADDVVLATYRVTRDDPAAAVESLRCSIWKLYSGKWQLLFHQGTLCASAS